jgi:methionyl-tRNA synthetase
MVDASVEAAPAAEASASAAAPRGASAKAAQVAARPAPEVAPGETLEPIAPSIAFDDFSKVDLRVARVLSAKAVEGSKKLLELRVDLGREQRTIFAGIRGAYEPASLEGRLIVVVANLAPRQMKVGLSEGMALAAGDATSVFLLSPDSGATPGQRVR